WSRITLTDSALELGRILVHTDPARALAVEEKALARLAEVKDNSTARNSEAALHAAASYALRRLHRAADAQQRIDLALRLLRDTKEYPSDEVSPGEEADSVVRASGDQLAETGQTGRAAEVYRELLDKFMAYKPKPESDLSDAMLLSRIY